MRPQTEEFLYFLLWTADSLARPTWRNLNDGFEAWAWRSGLGRRLAELERLKLLERSPGGVIKSIVRLTDAGKRVALGGRDPEERWNRAWDGRWRMVLFDVPQCQPALRYRLWRHLRRNGYGFLQNSVWITPDPIAVAPVKSATDLPDVEALIVIEGRPCAGESNAAIIRGAWDFGGINRKYERCLDLLQSAPADGDTQRLREWGRLERKLWNQACTADPLLPRSLLPKDYVGEKAWKKRNEIIARLAVRGGAQRV